MTASISHVTLNTGHVSRTKYTDVNPTVFSAVAPLLIHADGRHQRVPGPFRQRVNLTAQDDALMASLWGRAGNPILTFGVAPDAVAGGVAWSALKDHAARMHVSVHAERAPTPWLATVLLPTMAVNPEEASEVMGWAADFQRCVAFAWLARRGLLDLSQATPGGTNG